MQENAEENRTRWSSNTYFNLALMSFTLGYEKARWGARAFINSHLGGAAAIILLAFAFLIRIPVMFMEMSLGQFSGKGGMNVWDICPIAKGIGYVTSLAFFWLQVNYQTSCSYAMFYAALPFKNMTDLNCHQPWATFNCYTIRENLTQYQTCIDKYGLEYCKNVNWQHAAKQFWFNRVLKMDKTGRSYKPRPELIFYGFVTCVLVFLVNIHGTSSVEKTLWPLHLIPGLQLFFILFVVVMDLGGLNGLVKSLTPNFQRLFQLPTWTRSFTVSLISSGLGSGAYIAMGAQCPFRSPLYLKVVSMSVLDCVGVFVYTSIQFCYLGVLEYNTGQRYRLDKESDDPLLWSIVPQSFPFLTDHHISVGVWLMMFYSHLFLISFRALVIMVNIECERVYDIYPRARTHRTLTAFCIVACQFLVSVFVYTESGYVVFRSIERVVVFNTIPFLCFFETAVVVYLYGVTHFLDDSHFMLGIKAPAYWTIFYIVLPVIFLVTSLINLPMAYIPVYGLKMCYDCQTTIICVVPIIIICYAIVYAAVKKKHILNSSPSWGCYIVSLRKSRQMFAAHNMTKEYMYRQDRKRDRFQFEDSDLSSD